MTRIYLDPPKKSKRIYLDEEKEEDGKEHSEPKMSRTAAAARGLGQSSFGLGDEGVGAFQALSDVAGDDYELKDLLDRYKKHRDTERKKVEKAYKDRPKYAYGAEIAGAFVPGAGLLKGVHKLGTAAKRAAASGALTGYGLSKSDNLEDQAKDALVGGAIGGASSKVISKLAPKILGKTAKEMNATPKKSSAPAALEFLYDMPRDISEEYIKDPKAFRKAAETSTGEISSQFHAEVPEAAKRLLLSQSKESSDILKKSPLSYKGSHIGDMYYKQARAIRAKYDHQIPEGSEPDKTVKYLYRMGNYWKAQQKIRPERLKREIIDLDSKKLFSKDPGTIADVHAANKGKVRDMLDSRLKLDNHAYARKMKTETAESAKLRSWIEEKANKFNKIDNLLKKTTTKAEKIDPNDLKYLKDIQNRTDRDWLGDYRRASLNELLDKSQTQGSKRVKKWSEIGYNIAAILGSAGGLAGATGSAGAGVGAAALGTLGIIFGDAVDKYGKRMAYNSLERAAKMRQKIEASSPKQRRRVMSDLRQESVRGSVENQLSFQLLKTYMGETKDGKRTTRND